MRHTFASWLAQSGKVTLMDDIYEYTGGSAGLERAVRNLNDNAKFKGYIGAVIENGVATSVVIYDKTETDINTGIDGSDIDGVTVTLNNQEWAVFLQTRKDGDYSIARNGWIADYNDPCSFLDMWYTGGGNNDAQYSNPEYDAMIDAAKATSDPAERMSYFHKAEDIIIGQDWALGPIYFYTQKYMMADDISGAFYTPLGYFIYGYCTKG